MKLKVYERIKRIRQSKGLKQETVAEEIGLTHGAYSKIERGETDPNTARLQDIAKVLKVNVTDFFDDAPVIKENKNPNYGYASKSELDNLSHLVHTLIKEFEKLRNDLPKAPLKKKGKAK